MRAYFLRWVIYWMELDLQMNRRRLQECKEMIAHDENRLHYWQLKLMEEV